MTVIDYEEVPGKDLKIICKVYGIPLDKDTRDVTSMRELIVDHEKQNKGKS